MNQIVSGNKGKVKVLSSYMYVQVWIDCILWDDQLSDDRL